MSAIVLFLATLSVVAYVLLRLRARRRTNALQAGMFTGLATEIAALSAVPVLQVRIIGRRATQTMALRLAA